MKELEAAIARRYQEVAPKDHLGTMKGLGDVTAPTILAAVGTPQRFQSQAAFRGWTGIVPHASQSADSDAKGLAMTKAGPKRVKLALYQAAEVARQWDPQLAKIYHDQMVNKGKAALQGDRCRDESSRLAHPRGAHRAARLRSAGRGRTRGDRARSADHHPDAVPGAGGDPSGTADEQKKEEARRLDRASSRQRKALLTEIVSFLHLAVYSSSGGGATQSDGDQPLSTWPVSGQFGGLT